METSGNKSIKYAAALFFVFLALSCAHTRKEESNEARLSHPSEKSGETFGPPEPYGPEPLKTSPLVLVFGPGLARGFAYVGILKALAEEKIKVGAIVSTEFGGFISIFYTLSGTINEFEWSMQKVPDAVLMPQGSSFVNKILKLKKNHEGIKKTLFNIFGHKKITDGKTPIRLIFEKDQSGDLVSINEGLAFELASAALAVPGYLPAFPIEGVGLLSAGKTQPFPVSEAKALGIGPVVVIDLLSPEDQSIKNESDEIFKYFAQASESKKSGLSEADFIFELEMNGIGYLDFSKRSEIIFKGKDFVSKNIKKFRQLSGLQEMPEIKD